MYDVVIDFGVQFAVAIVSGLLLLALGYVLGRQKKLRTPHNVRTSVFGLQFLQNEKRVPVIHREGHDEVILAPEPFEIGLDKKLYPADSDRIALCIGSFLTDRIWQKADAKPPPVGYFSAGLAMVDTVLGSGTLPLSEFTRGDPGRPSDLFSYAYFDEGRFQSQSGQKFILYVSAIQPWSSPSTDDNLIKRGASIYLIAAIKYRVGSKPILVTDFEKILLRFR